MTPGTADLQAAIQAALAALARCYHEEGTPPSAALAAAGIAVPAGMGGMLDALLVPALGPAPPLPQQHAQ